MKAPLDRTPYPRDPRSRPIDAGVSDGGYAHVRDAVGTLHVVPDGPHLHPKVLGGAQPGMYAGDLTIEDGEVRDVTNPSGTFQFEDPDGLLHVAGQLRKQGLTVRSGAVRLVPADGSRPIILE